MAISTQNVPLLFALLVTGCSKTDPVLVLPVDASGPPVVRSTDASDVTSADASVTGDREYLLDFSGTPEKGRRVGENVHLAFNIKLGEPVRKYTFGPLEEVVPGIVATDDMATCAKFGGDGATEAIERRLKDLPPGDNAFVGEVNVDLFTADNAPEMFAGICYGYRQDGKWTWEWAATTMGAPNRSHKYTSKIRVNRGPIDAIKLVFNEDMKTAGYVTSIKFVARAM